MEKSKKYQLITQITSLLYDFNADDLDSIYSALVDIMYNKEVKTNGRLQSQNNRLTSQRR